MYKHPHTHHTHTHYPYSPIHTQLYIHTTHVHAHTHLSTLPKARRDTQIVNTIIVKVGWYTIHDSSTHICSGRISQPSNSTSNINSERRRRHSHSSTYNEAHIYSNKHYTHSPYLTSAERKPRALLRQRSRELQSYTSASSAKLDLHATSQYRTDQPFLFGCRYNVHCTSGIGRFEYFCRIPSI